MANYLKMTAKQQWKFTWRNWRLYAGERRGAGEYLTDERTVAGRRIGLNAFGITPMGACGPTSGDFALNRLAIGCMIIVNAEASVSPAARRTKSARWTRVNFARGMRA